MEEKIQIRSRACFLKSFVWLSLCSPPVWPTHFAWLNTIFLWLIKCLVQHKHKISIIFNNLQLCIIYHIQVETVKAILHRHTGIKKLKNIMTNCNIDCNGWEGSWNWWTKICNSIYQIDLPGFQTTLYFLKLRFSLT